LDTFEIENMNRQAGARFSTLGAAKVDVMAEQARDINPDVRLKTFPKGINAINVGEFLEGVDVVVDGLDFFALEAREILYDAAERRGIPLVTAGPIGMSAAWLVFQPGGMSWRRYFRLDLGRTREDKLLLFAIGLTPKATQGVLHRSSIGKSCRTARALFIVGGGIVRRCRFGRSAQNNCG
jgi:molybdopterin/thiamine biosynthesis adenylyltransferase